jgi:5-deoxy-glucuronate isomerase
VTQLHLRRGTTTEGAYELKVTPERAGWGSSGRRIPGLEAGGAHPFESGEDELIVLPLRGGCAVIADGGRFTVGGPSSVFTEVTDFVHVPRDTPVELTSEDGGRFALPSAPAGRSLEPRYVAAADVPVGLRGTGQASRQVNNSCSPEAFAADRLIAVDVLHRRGPGRPIYRTSMTRIVPARRSRSMRSTISRWPPAPRARVSSMSAATGRDRDER